MGFINGNNSNNVLVGTSTDDEIYGNGGDDVLIGIGGHDKLDGGSGADTMDGGSGDDTYIVDNVNDEVVEYASNGKDTIKSSVTYSLNFAPNVENLILTGSADIDAYGNNSSNGLYGNSGDNILWGADGHDFLKGGGGDDYLNGGAGNDTMYGGTGDDQYIIGHDNFDDVIEFAGQGIDTVHTSISYYTLGANVENLVLTGSDDITGKGNELNNRLTGNSGNNSLWGGAGADIMEGGAGNDIYFYDHEGDVIIEYANQGSDAVHSSTTHGLAANVETLFLHGGNDNGYGNSLDNYLVGSYGDNGLFGNDGDDIIDGGEGSDTMYGGEGDDAFQVDNTGDTVVEYEGDGTDSVYVVGDFGYVLEDNVENLYFLGAGAHVGNEMNNIISIVPYHYDIHDNTLDGGLGQDEMHGGAGNDKYYVDNEQDLAIEEGALFGAEDVVFSTVDYTIGDHIEVLSLDIGSAISGTGNAQSNTIFGNAGNNILNGGGDADALSGLGGNDTFVFQAGEANGDTVYEFDGNGAGAGDVLQFVGYGTIAEGATFHQLTATAWQVTSADGLISETITLVGAPAIDAGDFMFV